MVEKLAINGGFGINGSNISRIILSIEKDIICPFCHKSIQTQALSFVEFEPGNTQIFLKCISCKNCFIGKTAFLGVNEYKEKVYQIVDLSKGNHLKTSFEKEITNLSPNFVQIFQEAEFAEQEKLFQICGVGYRKALEFLIKDYLIKNNPEKEKEIKDKLLGKCILEDIGEKRIKDIAEKAVWLGNDETHYLRKWENKDLSDLKNLIKITRYYISMELQADKYLEEMSSK